MISETGMTLSALRGFGKKMEVTAHNVANVESEGFKSQHALLREDAGKGVTVEISRSETPGPLVTAEINGVVTQRELSNVDLSKEMPEANMTARYYDANLRVLSTKDEMIGSILDIMG